MKSGGKVSEIVSFRLRSASQANGVCLSCHIQDAKIRNWMLGTHAENGVRCTDCHQIHGPKARTVHSGRFSFDTTTPGNYAAAENLVPESKMMFESRSQINDNCLRCHQQQKAEMNLPYHHPLHEGKMTCVDCHNPHGGPAGNNLRTSNVNQLCLSCHAQYRGPFMYQHPPVNENCLICHKPHGSPNTNLLAVSQPALCLQCHAGHHDGANLPLVDRCTDCHGSIHGSDVPTPSGGSRFVDKGGLGVPGFPQPATSVAGALPHAASLPAGSASPHAAVAAAAALASPMTSAGAIGASLIGWLAQSSGTAISQSGPSGSPDSYAVLSVTPTYRLLHVSGYAGRVGEYDSLQQSAGGDVESSYVSVKHHLTLLSRANVITADDYHVASQLTVGHRLQAAVDLRSFLQQQDIYPFYSGVISPDIGTTNDIPAGAVLGVKRRFGKASARLKLPRLPIHLFVKGDWQARVGQSQFAYLDENIDSSCSTCHYTSRVQGIDYTTRDVSGGVEYRRKGVDVTWQHAYSSFNDVLPFPSASLGPFENELELLAPLPLSALPDTPAGTYYIDIPSPNTYSADTLSVNWEPSSKLVANGQMTYRRARNTFTRNPQNAFDSNATLVWHPRRRLRLTADYRQQNLVNDFTPYFPLYGNMSYHEHWVGLRADYGLTKHLDVETRYQRAGITRSNAFLWPQIYSPDNTDPLQVVPSSSSNLAGLALRYHGDAWWNGRVGYEWTGTHDPGYVTVPESNNRIYTNLTLLPVHWFVFTNDANFIIQNAFPVIQRRNRFYNETASASLLFAPTWNVDLGYSYQQNSLETYMAFQNDSSVGYVLDEPFLPYKQLSQTYWAQFASKLFHQHMAWNTRVSYNSARSGMQPDLNPNDAALMGNESLIQQQLFDPVLFQQSLDALQLGSTQVSQVIVPEWIGQSKIYYVLPRGFNAGLLFYYGSYKDYLNPNLDGVLKSFTLYVGRSW